MTESASRTAVGLTIALIGNACFAFLTFSRYVALP
ncbi:hypothetical protein GGR39_001736 [Novosphingobium fluoreni]|uniref:Uncharacterized protein n=1 Tax=Novosphingobium fluoreni TaxID=1391222 RepID=A0A7W6BY42_9SPHN|nr:hypothetical protein [Novosphingobium fluoreni]